MGDFATRFSDLLQVLSDPDALFHGATMRDDLLALESVIPDRASETRLFRELAVLEGKRDELVCLEHADRALAANADTNALSKRELYFMHLICGDAATAWSGGARTVMHLERALALHAELNQPIGESFAIRLNRGIYDTTIRGPRLGLDWFEPLLVDAEKHYGADSKELGRLLGLMSASEEKLGNMPASLAYGERSFHLVDYGADPGRRVSALMAFAGLNHRAGQTQKAHDLMEEAISFADANCSPSTQQYARDAKARIVSSAPA